MLKRMLKDSKVIDVVFRGLIAIAWGIVLTLRLLFVILLEVSEQQFLFRFNFDAPSLNRLREVDKDVGWVHVTMSDSDAVHTLHSFENLANQRFCDYFLYSEPYLLP